MYLTPFSFSSRSLSISSRLLALFLLAFVSCDVVVGGAVLQERQDGVSGSVVSTAVITSTTRSGYSPSTTSAPKSGTPTSVKPQTSSSLTREPVPTLIQDGGHDDLDPNTIPVYSGVGLPIMPEVTPGIAVAGVLLMLAGIPFCLIGIKKTKLQIFLSVAYLCSLGVTVLIVYVMNPPIKDAIQGAYVVAATITGLFFGAIAVIFPEVTEKLGCLLGGFCLSMWFLVLKPGGLMNNTYGKLIMIAVFSLVVFGLAFHRVTKPYALISACAFSGATSVVLGIDCFSRAGLKEFWLYIWDLNSSMFPLNTDTYPHTRGMRVEIAIILLITIFGIMSQMKLWKILKERRDQKRAQRLKEQEDVEKLNEDVGRRVEEEDRRARAEWEKIYGNVDNHDKETRPDSGVAPSQTDSRATLTEDGRIKEVDGCAETEHMKQDRDQHVQMARQRIEGENIEETAADAEGMVTYTGLAVTSAPEEQRMSTQAAIEGEGLEVIAEQVEEQEMVPSLEVISPPPPPVLIRQHVPYIPDEEDCLDDAMSLATYADTITHTAHLQGLSKNQEKVTEDFEVLPDSTEILPAQEAISEVERIAEKNSNSDGVVGDNALEASNPAEENGGGTMVIRPEGMEDEAQEKGNSPTQLQPPDGRTVSSITSEERRVASTVSGELKISSVISGDKISSQPASFADLETVQNHCSRIHKTYRTNEWAKHLADAEAVELDDLTPYVEEGVPEEAPVPVLVTQLRETTISEPRPNFTKSRRASHEHSPRAQTPLTFAVTAQIPHAIPAPAPLPTPAVTPTKLPVAVVTPPKPILKSTIIPIIPVGEAPVIEKPVTQNLTSPPPPSRAMSPTPGIPYESTLIGRRESMLKMRPNLLVQEQMIRAASPSGRQTPLNMGDTASVYNMNTNRLTPINMEDMTLSQRREYLLSQSQSRTQTPIPQLSPRNSFGASPPSPTAGTVVKQSQLLHTWRESLKQDAQISQQSKALWSERQALEALNEKQQAAFFKKEKEAEKVHRTALVEERMRTPVMLNAHREAMRKLQAEASTR